MPMIEVQMYKDDPKIGASSFPPSNSIVTTKAPSMNAKKYNLDLFKFYFAFLRTASSSPTTSSSLRFDVMIFPAVSSKKFAGI